MFNTSNMALDIEREQSHLTNRKSITTVACVEETEELGAYTLRSETLETIGAMVASHILSC